MNYSEAEIFLLNLGFCDTFELTGFLLKMMACFGCFFFVCFVFTFSAWYFESKSAIVAQTQVFLFIWNRERFVVELAGYCATRLLQLHPLHTFHQEMCVETRSLRYKRTAKWMGRTENRLRRRQIIIHHPARQRRPRRMRKRLKLGKITWNSPHRLSDCVCSALPISIYEYS